MEKIGKYEILDKVGTGGFAVVYRGHDPYIKRSVAVKVCLSHDPETRQRFYREAEIAGQMMHRNIMTVYDFGLHQQMPYLVEEYLPGEDLAQLIRRREPETLEEKLDLLLQIASGLEYAHSQGVIHRDIKPGNVRVLDNGQVKIMDFGTAKMANVESRLTQSGMTLGTVAYLSPERLSGQPSGLNSDLFSFGVLAYELLVFKRPFSGKNIPEVIDQILNETATPITDPWPECPPRLAEVIHGCLRKDPEKRYLSTQAVIRDLQSVMESQLATREQSHNGAPRGAPGPSKREAQLVALLDRSKEHLEAGRRIRAEVLLEEILELDPEHLEARSLLEGTEQEAARVVDDSPSEDSSLDDSSLAITQTVPQSRLAPQQRRISQAVDLVTGYLQAGELGQAAEAVSFSGSMLGDLLPLSELRAQSVESIRGCQADLELESRWVAVRMAKLLERSPEHEDRLRGWIAELDPAAVVPDALAEEVSDAGTPASPQEPAESATTAEPLVQNIAAQGVAAGLPALGDSPGEIPSRAVARKDSPSGAARPARSKQEEAVESIEKLLADDQVQTARQALDFAIKLLGHFAEAADLEARIEAAHAASPLDRAPGGG